MPTLVLTSKDFTCFLIGMKASCAHNFEQHTIHLYLPEIYQIF